MKIIIFDVGDGNCSLVMCPNGYGMMIDCGSHSEKTNPIQVINNLKVDGGWLNGMKNYGKFPITLLHITHPHDDHVRNAKRIKGELEPYLLHRRRFEEFEVNPPPHQRKDIHDEYKKHICNSYRGNPITFDKWGFNDNQHFSIPMNIILQSEELNGSILNNSSIIRYIEYAGIRILYGGDMEEPGWDWLLENNKAFYNIVSKGVDILVASHHGHISGYSSNLFQTMGSPKVSVLSKGSEANKDGTDVSSRYSENSDGLNVKCLGTNNVDKKYTLSTRANGTIYFEIGDDGSLTSWATKGF